MAYTLSNKYAKNLCKRTVPLQLIIKNVVTCFFGTQCIYFHNGDMSGPRVAQLHSAQSPLFSHSSCALRTDGQTDRWKSDLNIGAFSM